LWTHFKFLFQIQHLSQIKMCILCNPQKYILLLSMMSKCVFKSHWPIMFNIRVNNNDNIARR
jgi:hypothetical protein